jgi:ammonia channel protein AmtB
MWLVIGFGTMGALLGMMVGMTSEVGIVKTVVALLFALIGGAISAFLPKLNEEDRTLAGRMLASLSLCCLAGLLGGIFFTFALAKWFPREAKAADHAIADRSTLPLPQAVLKNGLVTITPDYIDFEKQQGQIDSESAYKAMYDVALELQRANKNGVPHDAK